MTNVETRKSSSRPTPAAAAGGGGFVYLLGIVASLIYFWTRSDTGGERVLAVLTALVWPAMLIYGALRALFG